MNRKEKITDFIADLFVPWVTVVLAQGLALTWQMHVEASNRMPEAFAATEATIWLLTAILITLLVFAYWILHWAKVVRGKPNLRRIAIGFAIACLMLVGALLFNVAMRMVWERAAGAMTGPLSFAAFAAIGMSAIPSLPYLLAMTVVLALANWLALTVSPRLERSGWYDRALS